MFERLDPIILFVKDFDLQLEFYRDVVGLKQKGGSYGWAEFDVGGVVFALHGGYKGHIPKENNIAVHFTVKGIHEVAEKLKAKGVKFTQEVRLQDFGAYNASFRDPEGNTFELIEEASKVPKGKREEFWEGHEKILKRASKGKSRGAK